MERRVGRGMTDELLIALQYTSKDSSAFVLLPFPTTMTVKGDYSLAFMTAALVMYISISLSLFPLLFLT